MKQRIRWVLLMILMALWGGSVLLDRLAERTLMEEVHERLLVGLRAHQQHLLTILAYQQRDLRLFAAGVIEALAEGNIPRLDGAFLSGHLPEIVGCTLVDAQGRLMTQTDVPGPTLFDPEVEMAGVAV